ncbi:uncharacterized protein LOC123720877 [Pieris brassicae]|uniref:uncharacterized protein LOC123720877 n=1 Tax=Pieris brassicae TaxID=7116 RepID=UPI001E65E447|nr:uncharacterized protein LOC123720877 [Pieris brassicae]
MITLFILIALVKSQEITNPSHQVAPSHFNYHLNPVRQYLEEVRTEPTKKGPVLFPNDAPPHPKPPLVVTSRPLAESIARSELNNSIADSSYISPVTYRPSFGSYNSLGYTNQQPAEQYNTGVSSEQDYSEGQNYAFSYIVKDHKNGDDFSHKQQSVGSATNGEYRVRLPDGRLQIVSYTADDNGYKANVRYDEQPVDNPTHRSNVNYVDNVHNEFSKPAPTYNVYNLDNVNYDFSKINYRDEIPVNEKQYDSKEYYDYSAENYKNSELYNPVSTVSPYVQENYQNTVAPYQPISHTTAAPYYQQNLYTSTAPFQYNSQLFQVNPTPSSSTTVRPAYEEIKHLFTTPNYKNIEINSPSSFSADDFVLIGNKNSYNLGLNQGLVTSTPASYIASSLSNLNDRINSKPVLSNSYIDRINKYLSFK